MARKDYGLTICHEFRGAGRDYYELRLPMSLRRRLSFQNDFTKDEAAISNQDACRALYALEAGSPVAREQLVAIRLKTGKTHRQMRWMGHFGVLSVKGVNVLLRPCLLAEVIGWAALCWSALFVGTMLCLFATTPHTGVGAVVRQFETLAIYSAISMATYATFVAPSRTAREMLKVAPAP